MPTVEVSDLQNWANDSEQAVANIKSLLSALTSPDQSMLDWGTEALENCGPPRIDDAEWLSVQLLSNASDVSYWAATLLGRLGDNASKYQQSLVKLAVDTTRTPYVRQRAIWALSRMNDLNEETKCELQKLHEDKGQSSIAAMAEMTFTEASKKG